MKPSNDGSSSAPIFHAENIPAELRRLPQFVCWHYVDRNGKPTKPPVDAKSNGKLLPAKSNDSSTWASFETAVATAERLNLAGIGLALSASDGLTGLDLDHVIDPATGELDALAHEVLAKFAGTYAEISPSGNGLRIWCYGKPQRSGKCIGKIKWLEVYSHPSSRYLTITGNHWPGSASAVTDQPSALDWLHGRFMQESTGTFVAPDSLASPPVESMPLDDAAIIAKAHKARNGAVFGALWSGDTQSQGGDHSAADLALLNLLAFWTNSDPARMDRLFRQSGLMRPKWDVVHSADGLTYGQASIAKAIADCREGYSGRKARKSAKATAPAPAADVEPLNLPTVSPCTHLANSHRIRHYFKGRIWYALGAGWILWTGQFWRPDPTNEGAIATGFVDTLSRRIAQEAGLMTRKASEEADTDRRKSLMTQAEALLKWAVQSENAQVIAAGLKLSKHALLIEYRTLNADPWLFNVQNGTIDLRTGTLRPHNPGDLITFIAPVVYDPTATCPHWERFVSEVFGGDLDMVAFIQRGLGWSLTGVVKERALFFLYGDTGKNGKTTMVEAFMKLVGDCGESSYGYGRKVGADTFMRSRNSEDNQRKAATLAGPRFICTSEVDEEHRLNEQLIKDITGGDTLEGRKLYQEAFTFKPQFKPWMYGNHKPEIRGTDDAIWSRVRMVPFEVSFKGREDLDLAGKLEAELSGILNWAIKGCLDWQRHGLQPPAKVQAATDAYRAEMDVFGPFIAECCVVHRDAEVWSNQLYSAYSLWCVENAQKPANSTKFGRYLTAKGFRPDGTSGKVKRMGLGLKAVSDSSDSSDSYAGKSPIKTPYSDFSENYQNCQNYQKEGLPPVESLVKSLDHDRWR
jgi:putative DNA primase/helicase